MAFSFSQQFDEFFTSLPGVLCFHEVLPHQKTIKKTMKKTDIVKMMKGVKKTFKNYNMEQLHIPY